MNILCNNDLNKLFLNKLTTLQQYFFLIIEMFVIIV